MNFYLIQQHLDIPDGTTFHSNVTFIEECWSEYHIQKCSLTTIWGQKMYMLIQVHYYAFSL